MDKLFLEALRARRHSIQREWLTLLRAEPVSTPLGHPDTLSHLIDRTLDEVFGELAKRRPHSAESHSHSYDEVRRECACGRNPLLTYFLAGERALLEGLVQAQAESPSAGPAQRNQDLAELYIGLRGIARREVRAICSVCQHKSDGATRLHA